MDNFKLYAAYYDLLYKDKDYHKEVSYINQLITKYSPKNVQNILDLGCGTGRHDFILTSHGYKVLGVDISKAMIDNANESNHDKNTSIEFKVGDARTFRADSKFDAVISLFHVASYQTTNNDLQNYFKTAREHLEVGGIFIFDCWYGPGVLTDKPTTRVRKISNENFKLIRIAESDLDVTLNKVDVNYTIQMHSLDGKVNEFYEKHPMRYLFNQEIEQFNEGQFEVLHSEEFLSGQKLSPNSWNATFVLKAI